MATSQSRRPARRSWWSHQFIQALESFTEPNRLQRGRSYSSDYRLKSFEIKGSLVLATVRGSINPYFNVHKEPTYITTLEFQPISRAQWAAAIAQIGTHAGLISRLMMNEIPDNIEDSFRPLGLGLLPQGSNDCKTSCSCPDHSNPCKHIAGLYYRVAQELDTDPFLLFELRGLSRDALKQELAKSPLGVALCGELNEKMAPAPPVAALYCRPETTAAPLDLSPEEFWQGSLAVAPTVSPAMANRSTAVRQEDFGVAAIAIKKQGDYPPFWQRDNSFIEAMEEFYRRVRHKNKDILE
ncbi:MAG: hypothetical protein HC824_13275 [Synechococcales cyanobacterium RM1_1_8]|nr:hypothetical protein [Synechococcales cyanobacterium RM1_1_8]